MSGSKDSSKVQMAIKNSVVELRSELTKFEEENTPTISKRKQEVQVVLDTTNQIEESWSGSWLGYHAGLYFSSYQKPPSDKRFNVLWGEDYGPDSLWQERTINDLLEYIVSKTGVNTRILADDLKNLIDKAKRLRSSEITELSLIRENDRYTQEAELLQKIEGLVWGSPPQVFINHFTPKLAMSTDSRAMAEGLKLPPHIGCRADALAFSSTIADLEEFIDLSKRLIRQLEIKLNFADEGDLTVDAVESVAAICKRFHLIARQLQSRHANRTTLQIDDEYDVQDLLYALLRLYFDDIRPEEWTPSYAGSSSRIDFLLKNENIVIEVKKTRTGLTDKAIGEQLLIDIAKYRQHTGSRTLFCFVYDPEGKIGNPRGLESDLRSLSTDDMNVIVLVEPS